MREYKPYIDENGRLYLFSLCDGTLIFLQQLIVSLERLGCKDIRRSQRVLQRLSSCRAESMGWLALTL